MVKGETRLKFKPMRKCVPLPFHGDNAGVSAQMKRLRASSFKVKRISGMPAAPAYTIKSRWGHQSSSKSCRSPAALFRFRVPGLYRAIALSRRTGGVSAQGRMLHASSFKVKITLGMPAAPACTIKSRWGHQAFRGAASCSSFSFCVPGPFRAIAFSRRDEGVSAQMKMLRASSFKVKRILGMPAAPAYTIKSLWGHRSIHRAKAFAAALFYHSRYAIDPCQKYINLH